MGFRALQELISPSSIEFFSVDQSRSYDKIALLSYLLDRCLEGKSMQEKRSEIWLSLSNREASMSTGIGLGVAIPHCSCSAVEKTSLYIGVLAEGIDYAAIDSIPVRIMVLILFPKERFEKHIQLLATIARILNKIENREAILNAKSNTEVVQIFHSQCDSNEMKV